MFTLMLVSSINWRVWRNTLMENPLETFPPHIIGAAFMPSIKGQRNGEEGMLQVVLYRAGMACAWVMPRNIPRQDSGPGKTH